MKRRITIRTLENKTKKWQRALKLEGWSITPKFVDDRKLNPDPDSKMQCSAQVNNCYPPEKVAVVEFSNKYFSHTGHGTAWNIDTLILHELIHVLLWDKVEQAPENMRKHSKFQDLEEFICDSMSRILFDNL